MAYISGIWMGYWFIPSGLIKHDSPRNLQSKKEDFPIATRRCGCKEENTNVPLHSYIYYAICSIVRQHHDFTMLYLRVTCSTCYDILHSACSSKTLELVEWSSWHHEVKPPQRRPKKHKKLFNMFAKYIIFLGGHNLMFFLVESSVIMDMLRLSTTITGDILWVGNGFEDSPTDCSCFSQPLVIVSRLYWLSDISVNG